MRSMIYPAPPVAVGPPPAGLESFEIDLGGHGSVHGWASWAAPAGAPAVVFFHGNGENLETMRMSGLFEDLDRLGVRYAAVDYPGYGRSRGRPSEEANRAAALAVFDWMKEHSGDGPRVAAGWSLGAAVAIDLAARRPGDVAALAALSPWSRLEDVAAAHFPRFLVRLLLPESYDSLAAAAGLACPALVVHGASDRIIPVEQGRRVAAALGPEARWVEVPGAGHNDLLGQPEVWRELAGFFDRLRPSAPS